MLRGLSLLSIASGASAQSLKVFLMLGQSNMEGQGIVAIDGAPGVGNGTLEYLALNPPTSVPVVGVADAATERIGYAAEGADWKAVLDADGNFTSYPNVWSWGNEGQAHGALRPGMGVSEYRMGPEYGFGAYVSLLLLLLLLLVVFFFVLFLGLPELGPEYGFSACVRHTRALYFVFGFSPPRPPLRECRSCRPADRR